MPYHFLKIKKWNSAMVNRVQMHSGTDNISKKFCRKLRQIMLDLYGIIAQGANDIMEIRHGIKEIQDIRLSASAPATRSTGQADIRDWLIDSSGFSGADRKARLGCPAMVEDTESIVSEDQ